MKPSLLFAQNDAATSRDCRTFFSGLGFLVETASGGLECVAKLHSSKPDVLILDQELRWGGADGVLAVVEESRELSRVPVILIAENGRDSEFANYFLAPIVHWLPKPVDLRELHDSICYAFEFCDTSSRRLSCLVRT